MERGARHAIVDVADGKRAITGNIGANFAKALCLPSHPHGQNIFRHSTTPFEDMEKGIKEICRQRNLPRDNSSKKPCI